MTVDNNFNTEAETILSPIDPVTEASASNTINSNQPIGLSVASMVCGILSVVLCCSKTIALILSLIAVILGGVALKKQHRGRGMAIAGVTCGIIALIIYVILLLYGVLLGSALLYELS